MFSNKQLKKLIVPLMLEQLLAVLVGLVDTLMVSQTGEYAVAGVALVDNINKLMIMVLSALATGGAVICSQYIGKNEKENVTRACAQLEIVLISISILLATVCLIFSRIILRIIFGGVEERVMDCAVEYLMITALSYPFLGLYNSGAAIYRSMGNSKVSMNVSIIMNVVNVTGNALFVFVFKWSVFGVAMATLISRVFAGVIMTIRVCSKDNPYRISSINSLLPKWDYIKKNLLIGIPSGVENGMFQVGKLIVVSMIATFGTASTAANSVGYTIIDFANIAAGSMGLALITIVGQAIGAGKKDEAVRYVKKITLWAYIGDWCSNIVLFTIAGFLAKMFNLSQEAIDIEITILRAFAITSMFIWPLSFTISNALRAAGDVRYTMIVSIVSMWVFRVASSYILGVYFGLGVLGVWIGMFVDWAARSICFTIRIVSGKWLKRDAIV